MLKFRFYMLNYQVGPKIMIYEKYILIRIYLGLDYKITTPNWREIRRLRREGIQGRKPY